MASRLISSRPCGTELGNGVLTHPRIRPAPLKSKKGQILSNFRRNKRERYTNQRDANFPGVRWDSQFVSAFRACGVDREHPFEDGNDNTARPQKIPTCPV